MPLPVLPDREHLRALVRRRGTGLVLALIFEALILLMLLTFTPRIAGKREQGSLLTFGIEADKSAEKSEKREKQKRETRNEKRAEQKPQPPQPTPTPTPEPPIELPPNIIKMTRQEFAAADIARFSRSPSAATGARAEDQGAEQGEPDSAVVGKGPHGEPMYAAEWYRRPTDVELNTYITDRVRQRMPGAGLIRCRTVENYRVDDCNSVAENPVGSGLAEAVRQAAWQFRVRPPRVGGKPLIGTWVLIEIDYTITRARPGEPGNRP